MKQDDVNGTAKDADATSRATNATNDGTSLKHDMEQDGENETCLNEDWNVALSKAELKKSSANSRIHEEAGGCIAKRN